MAPKVETSVETTHEGNKTIEKTTTTTTHEDGRVETSVRTKTTTRTQVDNTEERERQEREREEREQERERQWQREQEERERQRAAEGPYKTREETRTKTTTRNGKPWKEEVTTTTYWSDGTSSENVVVNNLGDGHDDAPARQNNTQNNTQNALNGDIDRLNAEEALKRAMRGNDYDAIETCIEVCKKWNKHPHTHELIDDAYDRLTELRPENAVAIVNNKYKSLPFLGMKRYLTNQGVSKAECDKPLSKYELDKVAKKYGIRFPEDRAELDRLKRVKSYRN